MSTKDTPILSTTSHVEPASRLHAGLPHKSQKQILRRVLTGTIYSHFPLALDSIRLAAISPLHSEPCPPSPLPANPIFPARSPKSLDQQAYLKAAEWGPKLSHTALAWHNNSGRKKGTSVAYKAMEHRPIHRHYQKFAAPPTDILTLFLSLGL
ncbi:hypothetical protein EDD18DRAFT_1115962 [Armillaria luteobubalina]|uniref:Uncharacterized protein n=1 Tax=Armillaria luteobubalina TaxID=153913 RepID=A0AA39P130_9AGAR|nr:hypothetical protein EDD18DRAFT_1115962 [Armillaria luteobubalina]